MDAVKLLKEYQRMCKNSDCSTCELACHNDETFPFCLWECDYEKYAEQIVEVVEKWSIKHPIKTRKMDFLEKYPKAPLKPNGYPQVLPIVFGYCRYDSWRDCEHVDKPCWDLAVEEK